MEVEAENWRLCSATLVRGVAGELEAENWRRGSTTVVRGVAGEWEDENCCRYFVAFFCRRGDWKMSSIVVLNYI